MPEQFFLETSAGRLAIYTFATPEEIGRCTFDEQFSEHTGFRSLYTRSESLMRRAEEEDTNVVLAVTDAANIIGFGVLAYPEPGQRWGALGPKLIMEVKAVEVTRSWRSMKIGNALVKGMLAHPEVESKILFFVGYTWTWDLPGTKMTAVQYHKMMMRLFQSFGFNEYQTNEPNICLDKNNLFMCRIGQNLNDRIREDFKWLLFGIYPS